ncbi:hypothetical protein LCGC14_2684500, partial [marine sediment metagenome]
MKKEIKEICECGHNGSMHSDDVNTHTGECFQEINFDFENGQPIFCSCKKFKPQGPCNDCMVLHSPENCPKKENKERIEYLNNLIRMMREDEEIFGLVREDRDKIREWTKEI